MAELDLPPWLTKQADPLGSMAKGVQIGSEIGSVINQRDLTQSRLRLNEQDQQMNHLKLEKTIRERDQLLEADFIMQEVPDKIAPLLAAGKPNDARNVLLSLAARKPAVLHSDTYPKLLQEVEAAVQTETVRMQLKSNEDLRREMEAGRMKRQKTLDDLRIAQRDLVEQKASDLETGTGTETALGKNSKRLENAQTLYNQAVSDLNSATTLEDQTAAQAIVQTAKVHLDSVMAFTPHANEEARQKHQELMAKYGAQKQRILTELRNVDGQMIKPAAKEAKKAALKEELDALEEQYFPQKQPSQVKVAPAPSKFISTDSPPALEPARPAQPQDSSLWDEFQQMQK